MTTIPARCRGHGPTATFPFTNRGGVGVRVCNFGRKALARGGDIDSACPHKVELCSLLGREDSSPEGRFWGPVDPEVARRALGGATERQE